ncbi:MAG: T3SS (YopN, CesT) and YbjN peptide-binding chaperone 1 [Actinomycetales bacterium]
MDVAEFDLDRSVQRAWSSFRRRLADVLDGLGVDEVLHIEASALEENPGAAPYLEAVATPDAVHAEISGNGELDERDQLSDTMTAALVRLGWQVPDGNAVNFSCDMPRDDVDRLAAMGAAAFRDVWSVPHPTFLEAGSFNSALGITRDSPSSQRSLRGSGDREHIQQLVDEALARYLGQPPHKDSDGDIPIRSGSALVFIRVLEDEPLVELKSPLVVDIAGRTRAAEVVADLNATWRQAKFVLVRDVVVLLLELPTTPFIAEHLIESLALVSRLADDLDNELAERLGGRLPFAEPGSALDLPAVATERTNTDDLPAELVSLLHLGGADSTLTAEEVARICGTDRDRILDLLRIASAQEVAWRHGAEMARLDGEAERALRNDAEALTWQDTVERLRAALRFVLTSR